MILPNPTKLKTLGQYSMTLTLTFLNVFLFVLIFGGKESTLYDHRLLQNEGLLLSGRIYYQYLQKISPQERSKKPSWMRQLSSSDEEHLVALGTYALHDSQFLQEAETLEFHGDEVQIASWKKDSNEYQKKYSQEMLYRFGLSSYSTEPLKWITYQFSHSNLLHLVSNMIFLLVIGAATESLVGGSALVLLYLIGGIIGGWGFLFYEGSTTVPMVGASASISALLGFYCLAEAKLRIRYFYFISPLEGHMGFIYLPTLLILPLFLIVDIANLWSSIEGIGGGVAYAAHLGGSVFGLIVGGFYRFRNTSKYS